MQTFRCSIEPDPRKRPEPRMESSVLMKGRWSFHAYKRSNDGKHNIIFREEGYEISLNRGSTNVRYEYPFHGAERGFYWSPDNTKLIYFGSLEDEAPDIPRPIVMLDIRKVSRDQDGGKPPHKVMYAAPVGHRPFGLEWSPSGEAFYVVEKLREDSVMYSRIMRVPIKNPEKVTQVARINGVIDFFMPPVSRFEDGEGPSTKKYWIVFGHYTGLYLCDPKGSKVRRVAKIPATGLHNIEWHPRKNKVLLFFRKSSLGIDGNRYRGVYYVHLDKIGRTKKKKETPEVEAGGKKKKKKRPLPDYLEHLYDDTDIHTLWFSPNGTYMSWAGPDALYFRKSDAPASETTKLVVVVDELELEIKGVTWHKSERKLAFTAGNNVFVYELNQAEPKPRMIATFGSDTTHFTAEPIWLGDEVYLTVFQDLGRNKRRGSKSPSFVTPKTKKDTAKALQRKAAAEARAKAQRQKSKQN